MKKYVITLTFTLLSLCLFVRCAKDAPDDGGDEGGGKGTVPAGFTSIAEYASFKSGQDWAPAFAQALIEKEQIFVPAGTYPCNEVSVPSNRKIRGAGNSTVFVPLGTRLFVLQGSYGTAIPIAADIADFSSTILLTGSATFAAGDDIIIRGQRNCMIREGIPGVNHDVDWVLGRTRESSCFFGEMDVVASATGVRIITASNRIFPHYYANNSREPQMTITGVLVSRPATTVSKMNMVKNVTLSDFAITGTAKCTQAIYLTYSKDCLVERVNFSTSVEAFNSSGEPSLSPFYGIYVWNTKISDCEVKFSTGMLALLDAKDKQYVNFSNYNLFRFISCVNSGFENCRANGGSHAFNITRSAAVAGLGIPSYKCYIRNCTASNCTWSGVTVQQACYETELSGNTVTASGQGIITAGRNTRITNNTVSTNLPYSTSYYYTLIARGGTFGIGMNEGYACGSEIRNNKVSGFYTGIILLDGYEDKNCFEEGNIVISGNSVTDCLRGFGVYKNPFCENLGRNDLNVEVSGNTFTRSGALTVMVGSTNTDTYGIYLPRATAGITVSNNTFQSFAYGVRMEDFVDYVSVKNNSFTNGTYGIFLRSITPTPSYKIRISQSGNTFSQVTTQTSGLEQNCVDYF